MTAKILKPGQILKGSFFNEPMRVETIRQTGPDTWALGFNPPPQGGGGDL